MDTMSAFAMGEAHRGERAKVFDWDKAAAILANGRVQSAGAGLSNDWDYTGGDILRDGEPVDSDDTYTYLASTWATPELMIHGETCIPCWRWEDESPGWGSETYWPDSARAIFAAQKRLSADEMKAITASPEAEG
jgi:hypothetical protein